MSTEVRIFYPVPDDGPISDGLRALTEAVHRSGLADGGEGGLFGGSFGYGANYENDVFLLHRYCWCEDPQCPWCGGCYCASNDIRGLPESQSAAPETLCDWCADVHRWADKGALRPDEEPHYGAPHFWHKPSGTRIWWYKYIGRSMSIQLAADWTDVLSECLSSLPKVKP